MNTHIVRAKLFALYLVWQLPIVGVRVEVGRHGIDFGVTWPYQLVHIEDTSIYRRWKFCEGKTALWGVIRWNT